MRHVIGWALVVTLIVVGCGDDDDGESAGAEPAGETADGAGEDANDPGSVDGDAASESTTEEPLDVPTGGDAGDLCALGRELEQNDQFSELTLFDGEEFFSVMGDVWSQVARVAPSEVQGDVATIQEGLDDMRAVLAEYDYDVFDPAASEAIEAMDTAAMDDATDRFTAYLSQKCGTELGASSQGDTGAGPSEEELQDRAEELENLDLSGDEAEILAQVFGIDVELARCLNDELGGLDPDNVDPSVMTQEVCGTTLLDVISGAGG